jgi:hypothetical protein
VTGDPSWCASRSTLPTRNCASRLWGTARFLEVARGDNSLGLARGDYRIERRFANGRVGLVDEQGKRHRIDP